MTAAFGPFVRQLTHAVALGAVLGAVACGGDDGDGGGGSGGAATGGAGATAGGGGTGGSGGSASGGGGSSGVDAFNGDCTTAKWGDVSDACWSCMCQACANTLNTCDDACMGVMKCAFESECMVNQPSEVNCEISCVGNECLADPAAQAAAQSVVSFDACLIGAEKPSGFRICEDVCSIPYTGDVCTRYPQQ
jgi:hypothetical protein